MSRPVDADPARTYDAIVEAALGLLDSIEHPDELSMRKVAARADVSVSTVQYYFGSKTDLLEVCLDGHYDRLQTLSTQLAGSLSGLEPDEVVPHVARAVFRWLQGERALIRLRMVTNARRGELHPRRQPHAMRDALNTSAAALAPFIGVDPLDARLAFLSLSAVAHRLALLSESELQTLTDEHGGAAVEDYFVRAAVRLLSAHS